jgi:undecaprenyl-phosphate 4-deoxy-4-formamido-L-arabinose transferase
MNDFHSISVVIPVYNEEQCLDELIHRCVSACEKTGKEFEVLLVDDGSADRSREILAQASEKFDGRVVAVLLNRNYGQHTAVIAGFAESRGDVIITLDADLQNPPEEIPNLVAKMEEGYDVVGTVRENRQDTKFRKLASYMVNRVAQKSTGVLMHDYGCMLRAYRRPVIEAVLQCEERSTFIPVLANSFASRTTEIDVRHAERTEGESKYSVWKLVNLQFDLLTSMTTFPLRMFTVIGTTVSGLGVLFGVFLLAARLFFGAEWAAQGVFTLFAVLFVIIGIQLLGIGLIGEYIGRIYDDVRRRPRYFVQEKLGRRSIDPPPSSSR